jgi:hypothetical protein
MRGIELTPGDIQNAGENGAQTIEPNANFHLSISHKSQPKRNADACVCRYQNQY